MGNTEKVKDICQQTFKATLRLNVNELSNRTNKDKTSMSHIEYNLTAQLYQ